MTDSRRSDRPPAYSKTQVPVAKSQEEIRAVLRAHKAESFQFGEGHRGDKLYAGVEFQHGGVQVRMLVPIKVPTAYEREDIERAAKVRLGTISDPHGWAEKRTWRVIAWTLRARMIAVEEGVETFEQAFLPHIVNDASGRTFYEELSITGRLDLGAALPALEGGR